MSVGQYRRNNRPIPIIGKMADYQCISSNNHLKHCATASVRAMANRKQVLISNNILKIIITYNRTLLLAFTVQISSIHMVNTLLD